MTRPNPYKVRVKRSIECWVDVRAHDGGEAETMAWRLPAVTHVFPGTAALCSDDAKPEPRLGVEDPNDERD